MPSLSEYCRKLYLKYDSKGFVPLIKHISRYLHEKAVANSPIFKARSYARFLTQRMKYESPADPQKLIWVNPGDIKYSNTAVNQRKGLGQVLSGDWDNKKTQWRDSWRYTGLKQRFVHDFEWEETLYVEKYQEKIEEEGYAGGCSSIDEFLKNRCPYLDELYHEMSTNGYTLASERSASEGTRLEKSRRRTWKDDLEPFASITRGGEIHVNEGTHRRAIAEFAGVESVPLNVLVRHEKWQRIRDEFAVADSPTTVPDEMQQYVDHPDLQDIVES